MVVKTFSWDEYNQIQQQASLCEQSNHFIMAAILWRRIGMLEGADDCELIACELAIHKTYILQVRKPAILGKTQ